MLMLETQLAMQQRNKKIISYISDSTRKRIGRRVLRANSKVLFVGTFCLVLASFGVAALIANQKEGSEAVTRSWVVSSSQNGFGGNLGWNFAHNGAPGIGASNNVGQNLKIWFPAGGEFNQTVNNNLSEPVHGCWRMPVPGNVRVHTVKFRITSNAAGANRIAIGIQNSSGYIEPFVHDRALNGTEALDFGGLDVPPGGIIQVCNRVTEDGNPATTTTTFGTERYFFVNDYAFFGNETIPYSYDVVDYVNPPSNMTVGQTAWVTWRVRNSGNQTWYGEGSANPTRLGTWNPADRASIFHSESLAGSFWIGRGRIAMQEPQVSPGQIATFRYVVTARSQGSFTEHFNLVTDGIAWHHPQPLFFSVNVGPMVQPVEYCANNAGVVTGSVEAERSVCGPDTNRPIVQADGAASGGKRVRLAATGQYAEYTFKPTTPGIYRGGGIMQSKDFNGSAVARIVLTKFTPGAASVSTSEDRVAPSGVYDRRFMTQTAQYQNLTASEISAGVSFRVRISFQNDVTTGERDLYSDTLYVEKVGDLPAPVEYCANNAGTVATFVEAERGICGPDTTRPIVQYDPAASGTKRTLLFASSQYAEYYFKPTTAGSYRGTTVVRSQDYNGSAVARISLTKITPNAASVTTDEERVAPSDAYDRRFMTQVGNYQNLTSTEIANGVSFRVRVTFTNDLNGGTATTDRNLFVDSIGVERLVDSDPGTGCNTAITKPANVIGRTQAQDAPVRSAFTASTAQVISGTAASVSNADLCNAVVALSNNIYIQTTYTAPIDTSYAFIMRGRSDVAVSSNYPDGFARAKVDITYSTPAVTGETGQTLAGVPFAAFYEAKTLGKLHQLRAGTKVTIKVTYINDYYGTGVDRNLWFDYLEMRSATNGTPVPESPSQPLPIDDVPSDIEAAGGVIIQAENARKRNSLGQDVSGLTKISVGTDPTASEGRSANAYGAGSMIEHRFVIPKTGLYDLGATMRSVDAKITSLTNSCAAQDSSNERACVDIYIDGVLKVNNKPVPSAFSYISATGFNFNAGTAHTIRIEFINDAYVAPLDRNLIIDRIILRARQVTSTPYKDQLPEQNNWAAWTQSVTGNFSGRAVLSSTNNQLATTLPTLSGSNTYNSTFMSCWTRKVPQGFSVTGFDYGISSTNRASNEILIRAGGKDYLIAPARASDSPSPGEVISYSGNLYFNLIAGQTIQMCTRLIASVNFNPGLTNRLEYYRINGTKVATPVSPSNSTDARCIPLNMVEAENSRTLNTSGVEVSGVVNGLSGSSVAATGGRAVIVQRGGGYIEHRFNVTTESTYQVGGTMLNASGNPLGVDIYLDGVKVTSNMSVTNKNFNFRGSALYNLKPGIHRVRIAYAPSTSTISNLWVDRVMLQAVK